MTHEEFTRCVAKRHEIVPIEKSKDQDRGKGAVEQDQGNEGGNTSLSGQQGTSKRTVRKDSSRAA